MATDRVPMGRSTPGTGVRPSIRATILIRWISCPIRCPMRRAMDPPLRIRRPTSIRITTVKLLTSIRRTLLRWPPPRLLMGIRNKLSRPVIDIKMATVRLLISIRKRLARLFIRRLMVLTRLRPLIVMVLSTMCPICRSSFTFMSVFSLNTYSPFLPFPVLQFPSYDSALTCPSRH